MWVSIARVSADSFAKIKAEPTLLDALFFDSDDASEEALSRLGIDGEHIAGFDYRLALEALEGMAEAEGTELDDDDDPVLADLAVSGELDYDAGYGPAFYITPKAAARAVDSIACHLDDEVAVVIKGANEDGDYLVGVVS